MCMHCFTKQFLHVSYLHIKDFQAFVMIMPMADCVGPARPIAIASSVLYWALSLSVGHL